MAKADKVTKADLEAALAVVASADKSLLTEIRSTVLTAKDAMDTATTQLETLMADQPTTGVPATNARGNLGSWMGQVRSYRDSLNMMLTSIDNGLLSYEPQPNYAPPAPTPTA